MDLAHKNFIAIMLVLSAALVVTPAYAEDGERKAKDGIYVSIYAGAAMIPNLKLSGESAGPEADQLNILEPALVLVSPLDIS
ncbi:MAG: hypothetical protein V3V61_02730 [Gammaproteobacteria bacterium]